MQRVLVLSQFYPPDLGAAAVRVQEHCRALASSGKTVTVLAPMASYPVGRLQADDRWRLLKVTRDQGVRVIRFRPIFVGRRGMLIRALAELWNAGLSSVLGVFLALAADVIVASSPSPFLGITGAIIKRLLQSRRYIWEVRDLTWQYAFDLGKVRGGRLARLTMWTVRWLARTADALVVTNPVQRDYFLALGVPQDRVVVVYNGVSKDELGDAVSEPKTMVDIAYVGLVGHAQGLGVLVEVASMSAKLALPVCFHVVGDGADLKALMSAAEEKGINNIHFYGAKERSAVREFYQMADILFAQLRDRPVFDSALPSKILEYMSAARPIIFAGRGPGAELVETARAGIVCQPENPDAILAAVRELIDMGVEGRSAVGIQGRRFAVEHFLRSTTAARFIQVIEGAF